jgi:hypothetical protein
MTAEHYPFPCSQDYCDWSRNDKIAHNAKEEHTAGGAVIPGKVRTPRMVEEAVIYLAGKAATFDSRTSVPLLSILFLNGERVCKRYSPYT